MAAYKMDGGRWFFQFQQNGITYKKKLFNGKPMLSKKEAQLCELQFKESLDKTNILLYDLFDEFIETTKSNLKIATRNNYDKFKRNYLIYIDNKIIHDISIQDITKWKNKMAKLDVSSEYIKKNISIMRKLLEYAAIVYDVKSNLQLPLLEPIKNNDIKDFETKTKYLPPNEFEAFIEPLNNGRKEYYFYYCAIKVLYYSGLRIGELAALNVEDYRNGSLYINKDYIRVGGKDYVQPPKTENSIRCVKLDKATNETLQTYIDLYQPTGVLFRMQTQYLNQQRLRRVLANLSKDVRFKGYEITPHTLRHSHASYLRELGFDEYTIARRLGNTPKVAASIYIHATENEQEQIIDKINKK